jgi:RNA polymerase sigma-70 factor (ECF subfamily)
VKETFVNVPSDEHLMTEVLRGSAGALTMLVERYHAPLLAYLYRLLGGRQNLAEDFVQESFLRLLQPSGYQQERPFKPWLYAIATNLARDYLKSASTRHQIAVEGEDWHSLFDKAPGPEEVVLATEENQIIAAAIGQLGDEYRSALLLRFYQGMSLQEIAETLHIPLGTVKSRLSVGTHRLRDLLTTLQEEEVKP